LLAGKAHVSGTALEKSESWGKKKQANREAQAAHEGTVWSGLYQRVIGHRPAAARISVS
jgi:hypothetical protein